MISPYGVFSNFELAHTNRSELKMICLTFYIDDCLRGVFVIAAPLGIAFRPTVARRVVVLEFCDDHESRQGSSAPDSL